MHFLITTGQYILFLKKIFSRFERRRVYFPKIIHEINELGMSSIAFVAFISVFVGAVVTLQVAYNMENPLLPTYLIGLASRDSIILEFSPTMISLVLAGKIGSHISSSLGTMRVTEQIDALEIMGVNSAGHLVLPKIIAGFICIPILVIISMFLGNISSWLILFMIFLSSMIVILRYVFEIGVVAMQELLVYSHGMLFLFYAALALKDDAHVRVDIFYRELSDKRKRMINIFGNLFFLQPFAWVILIFSFEYVYFAWSINEISPEPGGLPFVYLFKTSLIIFPILLILQSFSELIKLVFKHD